MSGEITLLFTGIPALADGFRFGTSTVALCRTQGRLILYDTGPYGYRPLLLARLRRMGLSPADIHVVVVSHLHWDHAMNLDLFRKADIVIHEREMRHAENVPPNDWATPPYLARSLKRLRLCLISQETELAPGVRVVELFGHTPGSIGLLVGNQLLAGDAVLYGRNAATGTSDLVFENREQAHTSIAKALAMAEIIYPGHDRPIRRVGTRIEYVSEYKLRMRLFVDPIGQDQEICFNFEEPRSFRTWPE